MKKFFDKENFLPSTFDKKAKTQSLVLSILTIVFFAISAFTFMNMLYAFADCIGSIVSGSIDAALRDFLRSLPLFLSLFMSLWTLLLFHGVRRIDDEEKRNKFIFKKAIAILAFAGVNILYVLIARIAGKYLSLVEGSPSPLFPLDSILFSLLFVAIGVFLLVYLKKLKDKLPLMIPVRGGVVKKARGLYCTFLTFWLLIAVFTFAGGVYSIFIYDFMHEYVFYGIMLITSYLLSPFLLGVWEFYYNELKEEKKKEFLLPLGLAGTCLSLLVVVLYFVALLTNLDAPSNAGFGMFPVAFSASVNMATMIVVATPLIVSVVALIKGLLARKKAKAE